MEVLHGAFGSVGDGVSGGGAGGNVGGSGGGYPNANPSSTEASGGAARSGSYGGGGAHALATMHTSSPPSAKQEGNICNLYYVIYTNNIV